jgi:HemY protein
MRRVIGFLVIATVVIAFAWWLSGLPGSVNAQIGDLSFSAPTPVAILAAIIAFVVLYAVIRLLVMIVRLPSRTRRMRAQRDRKRGETAITRTLLALASGDSAAARREAKRGRTLLGDTPQTLLLAAYAGRQAGQQAEAEAAFNLLAARKDAAFLGLRGLMQGAMARGDWSAATALAGRAEAASPGTAWLRAERGRLAIRAGAWKEALALSTSADPVATIGTAAAEAESDPLESRRMAKRAWRADQSFTPAALIYARRLREIGREKGAQAVLRTTWARAPHPDLAAAALDDGTSTVPREKRAQALVAAAPTHPESLLLLAQTALEVGHLPDALRHAEAARDAGLNQRRLWLLIATIAERSGNRAAQDDALNHAAHAAPDSRWLCENCAASLTEWLPVCPSCGTVGRVAWGSQPASPSRLLTAESGDPILP